MMDRREFVKYLAATAAGLAALPEQLRAFEYYYHMNSPLTAGPLVSIDEVSISGLAWSAIPANLMLRWAPDKAMNCALNLFGGVYFWRAPPDGKIIAHPADVHWKIESFTRSSQCGEINDRWVQDNMRGHISYVGNDAVRRLVDLTTCKGSLA